MTQAPIKLFPLLGMVVIGLASLSYATPITIAPGTLTLPGGATLNLTLGEQFRLAYVTADFYSGSSSDIATYNTDVNDEAGDLSIAALAGIGWKVIGSTDTVSALQNIGTDGVRVYNLGGQEVASNDGVGSGGLFSGGLMNPIDFIENGTGGLPTYVMTGTQPNGSIYTGLALGDSNWLLGVWSATNLQWTQAAEAPSGNNFHLYGISDEITVGAVDGSMVPEPGTLSLMMLGGMFLAGKARKRWSQSANGTIPSTPA